MRLTFGKVLRGRRVVVHTKRPDDQTIAGVLIRETSSRLTLVDAQYVASASARHELDNTVHVPVENVAWLEEVSE